MRDDVMVTPRLSIPTAGTNNPGEDYPLKALA